MRANSFLYSLGRPIDTKKIKLADMKIIPHTNFLFGKFGKLGILIMPNGYIRTFSTDPETSIEELSGIAALKVQQIANALKTKLKLRIKPEEVALSKIVEELNLSSIQRILETRNKEIYEKFHLFLKLKFSVKELLGTFNEERVLAMVGLFLGRSIVKKAAPKSIDKLLTSVAKFFKKENLGFVKFEKISPTKFNATIEGCIYAGLPPVNEPYCELERTILRGAFEEFIKSPNIAVRETECWGLGQTHCKFEITITAL
ncbi:MAG: hypothetical protein DRO04_00440 [Candidatus Iainarchaeum archaeon]|uniref:4-vinyl reductase 4VR domain-containing protein n=1 Tax=Candidatus Iainarchaeum sp. TaxID=3101447 RepID=A0A497JI97_9ARCH|nr:MAG: hypothetical protein DRO04_00440 [Candidatus Diapherotrites archaeon]